MHLICRLVMAVCLVGLVGCESDNDRMLYFAGDSIAYNWPVEECFPSIITDNRAMRGSGIARIEEQLVEFAGKEVVIIVGTNDLWLAREDMEAYVERYVTAIGNLKASKVYLFPILPRSSESDPVEQHDFIFALNQLIRCRADILPEVVYVDVYDEFLYERGLNPAYTVDGLHLSRDGYRILTDKLFGLL